MASAVVAAIACGTQVPASAGELAAGFVPEYSGPQWMLYVSRRVGGQRRESNTFGLRYERAAPISTDPAAQFCAPLRHRTLVELQLVRGALPRMLFGPSVTWDMGRRLVGPTGDDSIGRPLMGKPLPGGRDAVSLP